MPYRLPNVSGIATPSYEIRLSNREIPSSWYNFVEEIVFEANESGADTASVYIKDPHMMIMGDRRILRGEQISISGGWQGDRVRWITGFISMIDIDFPETGDPTMILTCMDESYQLDRMEIKFNYTKQTFSQIASAIATKYSLRTQGKETTTVIETASQANETDIKFLIRLGDAEGLNVKVTNGRIVWQDRNITGTSQDTYFWRIPPFNLKSFSPRIVVADIRDAVEKSDVNVETGETETGTADARNAGDGLGTDSLIQGGMIRDSHTGVWRPFRRGEDQP